MKRILLFALLVVSIQSILLQSAAAQSSDPDDYGIKSKKAVKIYLDARHAMAYRDYRAAAGLFTAALEKEPNFGAALLGKGTALYYMNQRAEALPLLEKGLKNSPNEHPQARLTLAGLYLDDQRYADAETQLLAWQKAEPRVPKHIAERVVRLLAKTKFAQEAMENPIKFEPKNLGPGVNSGGHEYMPVLTADGKTLIFTARREECIGGFNYEMGGYEEDFFISRLGDDGNWKGPENIGPPINTASSEGACTISPDGRKIYFTANHPQGIGERDIYVADFDGSHWSNARILSPLVNSPFRESYPSISPDGKTLYFVSRRPGGEGDDDIWYSEMVDGNWTRAKNMGSVINTSADDNSPQIHADDQTLYFSSAGHPGFGSMDLFMSERQANGSWGPPRNLGYPLNTNRDERTIFVNTDGKLGFISSDREGGMGKIDIYSFEMDPSIQPKPATYVRGIVLDAETQKHVGSAKVKFVELATGDTVRGLDVAPKTGRFMTNIPLGKDYAAYVEAPGYLFNSKNFSLKNIGKDQRYYDLVIDLDKLSEGRVVLLDNIFFDFDKTALLTESVVELKTVLRYLKENPGLTIEIRGHTDDKGTDEYNLKLSQERADAVKQWLIDKGIDPTRLTAKGYGESKPLVPNDSDANRALNRRTEFEVIKTE